MWRLGPFGGLITSITPFALNPSKAQYLRNVRIETGDLSTRNGFAKLADPISGFTGAYGFDYVKGYAGLNDPREAFLLVQGDGAGVRPFEVHPTTGAASEITDGVATLSLGTGLFKSVSFNGQSLVLHRGVKVYEHNVGELDHFQDVDVDRPGAIAAGPSIEGEASEDISTTAPLTTVDFTTASGVTDATNAIFVAPNGTGFDMDRGASVPANQQAGGFTIAHPGGTTDYTNLTQIEFTFTGKIDSGQFSLSLKDSTGNTFALECSHTYSYVTSTAEVTAMVPSGSDLSEFDDTTAFIFGIPGTGGVPGGYFADAYTISELSPGEAGAPSVPTVSASDWKRARFGFAAYDSNRDVESEAVTAGAWVKIDQLPTRYYTEGGTFLGNTVTVTAPAPVAPADRVRLYIQFEEDNIWRLLTTMEGAAAFEVTERRTTLQAKPERILTELTPVGAPSSIAVFKGFVVYGYRKPSINVRMSAIGQPWRLRRAADTLADLEAGADWSIADAFEDVPAELVGAGDVLFALGERGVYASYGLTPQGMTPFRHVPKSKGIIGHAACRFQGDDGAPGVAYVGEDQEVWLIKSATGIREDFGFPVDELTREARGAIRTYLTQTDAPDTAKLAIGMDLVTDSLWVTYENRAMVLRKPNAVDGGRGWEFYEYAGTGWSRIAAESKYGIRAIRTTGQVDTLERTAAGAAIRGTARDGGSAMPEGKWRTGITAGERSRVFAAVAHRPNVEAVRIEIASDEATSEYNFASGKRRARMAQGQQGLNHTVTVLLSESEGPVSLIELEIQSLGKRRDA